MRFKVSDSSKVLPLVAAFMALGYEACGGTTGLGFLQAANGVTKDNILSLCPPRARTYGVSQGTFEVYGDYVAGRMMKTSIVFNEAESWVEIMDRPPTPDYQGWCSGEPRDPGVRLSWTPPGKAKKYGSYRELLAAAATEVGMAMALEANEIGPLPTPIPRSQEEIDAAFAANPIKISPLG